MWMSGEAKITFRIQQAWDAQLVFSEREGVLQVLPVAPPPHRLHVHQVGPDGVHHRLEGHAIAPTGAKVPHLDPVIPDDKGRSVSFSAAGRWCFRDERRWHTWPPCTAPIGAAPSWRCPGTCSPPSSSWAGFPFPSWRDFPQKSCCWRGPAGPAGYWLTPRSK